MFAESCNIHRISKSAEEGLYGDHFGLESETALITDKVWMVLYLNISALNCE